MLLLTRNQRGGTCDKVCNNSSERGSLAWLLHLVQEYKLHPPQQAYPVLGYLEENRFIRFGLKVYWPTLLLVCNTLNVHSFYKVSVNAFLTILRTCVSWREYTVIWQPMLASVFKYGVKTPHHTQCWVELLRLDQILQSRMTILVNVISNLWADLNIFEPWPFITPLIVTNMALNANNIKSCVKGRNALWVPGTQQDLI